MSRKARTDIQLTPNAQLVLERRYLLRGSEGAINETPSQMLERVATAIARVEKNDKAKWAERFYALMASLRFLPNSPTLMNAGKSRGQLSACYVLPVGDSLEEIFDALKQAARIHQSGGGTGFSFSRIRQKGSPVRSSQGVASGPVSFMRIFDTATETIKQGGTRRGANMGILRVDHPDIREFIQAKRDQRSIVNFNVSVGVTDQFMMAVEQGSSFQFKDPRTGNAIGQTDARALFNEMVDAAWDCGDPGVVFLDRMNQFNPTPRAGEIESTNPCGEQPLLPYESCNLGSLNLGLYVKDRIFDWSALAADIPICVRFLDDVIDANDYPVKECAKITRKNRKIGLGVMGFADALLELGIPYDSNQALELGEKLMSFIDRNAKGASVDLARKRGPFPNWRGSLWHRLRYPELRNATVSTVAPTGTISMIAGASSSIEPIFSGMYYRNVLNGERLVEIHPAVERAIASIGTSISDLSEEKIAQALGSAWRPAGSISVESHVKMQAVFQRHSDSAVSKTINLPEKASREDVRKAYLLAFANGCKGITVYRDKSRGFQVLERPGQEAAESTESAPGCAICVD